MSLVKCAYCGHMISDKAIACPLCHATQEIRSVEERKPHLVERSYIAKPVDIPMPRTWMIESIFLIMGSFVLLVIWSLPFGIAGLVNASNVEKRWCIGDLEGATGASRKARKWFLIGLWAGAIPWILIALFFLGAALVLSIISVRS